MPIRFRCVYCDKLLGIARRKAGAVVNCPQCAQPLIVPTPEPEPAAVTAAPAPGKLFERDDFEAILQGEATLRNSTEAPPGQPGTGRRPQPGPLPPRPFAVEKSLPAPHDADPVEALPARPLPAAAGIVLSTGILAVLLVAAFILIVGAFGAGILVGRMLH